MKVIKINEDIFLIRHWGKWQYWLSDKAIFGDWREAFDMHLTYPATPESEE